MQVVILAAGRGTRFNGSEFDNPKPLIEWDGKTMTNHVIENFKGDNVKIILIKRDEHPIHHKDVNIINIDWITEGPACTAHLSKDIVDMDSELIIVNCDQIILDWDKTMFLNFARNFDAVLGCFISNKPNNSYVKLNNENLVTEVKEKEVISNIATNGLHYWKKARYFFESFEEMFTNKDTTNKEYYVAPTYNYLIKNGYKVGIFMFNQHHPIGTPEDLKKYLNIKKTQI